MGEEDGEERVRGAKRSGKVDRLSNLPDCLLFQVLSNLPTKAVVKSSVLSPRWRNLWKCVPVLDLGINDFPDQYLFKRFVDRFLGFNSDSCLRSLKLEYAYCEGGEPEIARWINTAVTRKVEHIDLLDDSPESFDFQMPTTVYTCESLVSLNLGGLTLPSPSPKFVSLPCLKVMDLKLVYFADELALETLISLCPVLECLTIERSFSDDLVVAIDAPRLKYLKLSDNRIASFILKNSSSLVEVCMDTDFGKSFDPNDVSKRNMIRKFLLGISNVRDMIITSDTLEVIYDYSRCEQVPLFRNLSFLVVQFYGYRWEMLPIFLASCPNLKYLVVECNIYPSEEMGTRIVSGPRCLLSSLKYVEIKRPLKGEAMEMKLVSYLLENSKILKKLTLCLDDSLKKEESVIVIELLNIPRLSSSCQVVVL